MTRSRKNRGQIDPYKHYQNSGWDWFVNENFKNGKADTGKKGGKREDQGQVEKNKYPHAAVLFKVHRFKCPCNFPYWCEWDSPLKGADEGQYCENPRCEDRGILLPFDFVISPTPCSFSEEKYFGEFFCGTCDNYWTSANAWAGKYQKCQSCPTKTKVYPFNMEHKEFDSDETEELEGGTYFRIFRRRGPHQRELCEKCIQIKGNCAELPRFAKLDITANRFYREAPHVRKTGFDADASTAKSQIIKKPVEKKTKDTNKPELMEKKNQAMKKPKPIRKSPSKPGDQQVPILTKASTTQKQKKQVRFTPQIQASSETFDSKEASAMRLDQINKLIEYLQIRSASSD